MTYSLDDDDDDDDDDDGDYSIAEVIRKAAEKTIQATTATTTAFEGMKLHDEEMDEVAEVKMLLQLLGGSSAALLKEGSGLAEYFGTDAKGRQMCVQINEEFREEREVRQRNEAMRYKSIIPCSLRGNFSNLLTEWRQHHGQNELAIREAMHDIARICSDRWDAIISLVSSVLLPYCTLKDLEKLSLTRKGLFFGTNTFQTLRQCMLQEIHRTKPVKGGMWREVGDISYGMKPT